MGTRCVQWRSLVLKSIRVGAESTAKVVEDEDSRLSRRRSWLIASEVDKLRFQGLAGCCWTSQAASRRQGGLTDDDGQVT